MYKLALLWGEAQLCLNVISKNGFCMKKSAKTEVHQICSRCHFKCPWLKSKIVQLLTPPIKEKKGKEPA